MKLILTCEHAGNDVPEQYRPLFFEAGELLNSHRGYDPGALDLFNDLKELTQVHHFQMVSRLVVEANRSLLHPNLFSEITKMLSPKEKKQILDDFYFPYRKQVEESIRQTIGAGGKVLHLSVHSFTPQLNGVTRNADIGLLYDPRRKEEKGLSSALKNQLQKGSAALMIRFNYPYLGKADGFTTYLRKQFPNNYSGIELEVNQKFVSENRMEVAVKNEIFEALKKVLLAEKQDNL